MVELSTVAAIIAAIGVTCGAAMAILQLRNLVIQRKVNMVIGLIPNMRPDFGEKFNNSARLLYSNEIGDYKTFIDSHGSIDSSQDEVVKAFVLITGYYESIGLLYQMKLLDRKLVTEIMGYDIVKDWDHLKHIVLGIRKEQNSVKSFEYFEFMAEDMRDYFSVIIPEISN